jgi:hypothetical protein
LQFGLTACGTAAELLKPRRHFAPNSLLAQAGKPGAITAKLYADRAQTQGDVALKFI